MRKTRLKSNLLGSSFVDVVSDGAKLINFCFVLKPDLGSHLYTEETFCFLFPFLNEIPECFLHVLISKIDEKEATSLVTEILFHASYGVLMA